jgi:1,4-dihydroxy-6-naphthoate synthase
MEGLLGSESRKPTLGLGLSPCPNDTFAFHALLHDLVPGCGYRFHPHFLDIETLNRDAVELKHQFTKISFHAWFQLESDYRLGSAGAALGRGCGPLVVARRGVNSHAFDGLIAVPGEGTTAALLLRLAHPGLSPENLVSVPFDRIVESVERGRVDAGVIIHESRFTLADHDLEVVEDLGAYWEEETGLPLPLGGIVYQRSLGRKCLEALDRAVSESARYALAHPEASAAFVAEHAQEMSPEVVRAHIALYVNDFTVSLGDEGREAVHVLWDRAHLAGLAPGHDAYFD